MIDQAHLLDELESSLAQQLDLARAGDLGRIEPLIGRVNELTDLLAPIAGQADEQQAAQLQRIDKLHRQLCLALAAQKQEAGQQLKKMRSGKGILRVYRNGSAL